MPFVKPGEATGEYYNHADHLDHLVIFRSPEHGEKETSNGTAQIAQCSEIVCLDCEQTWGDSAVFGKVIVRQLTTGPEGDRLGRVAQGEARGGFSPPWLLEDPTDADVARAESYDKDHGAF